MSARAEMLRRVRIASQTAVTPVIPRDYRQADDTPPSIELFIERLVDYRAIVHRCGPGDVPALLAALTKGRLLVPAGFPEAWLATITAEIVRDDALSPEELDSADAVLTTCALAIAETGTVVLDGGPGQGRRALTLVPDRHLLVVLASQVVATVPQGVARMSPQRPQTWISGPSATSDIELQRVEGVHGPRNLEVVLVDA